MVSVYSLEAFVENLNFLYEDIFYIITNVFYQIVIQYLFLQQPPYGCLQE